MMRGRDTETGEFLSPSRSQQRRDALAVFDLAERLVAMGERELSAVPMPEDLRGLVRDSRRITAQIARKRQLQFLAKIMRREDDEVIDAIRRALERDRDETRRDTARLHRLEATREHLLAEGDEALALSLADHDERRGVGAGHGAVSRGESDVEACVPGSVPRVEAADGQG